MRVVIDARAATWSGVGRYVVGLIQALAGMDRVDLIAVTAAREAGFANGLPNGVQDIACSAQLLSLKGLLETGGIARRDDVDIFHAPMYVAPWRARTRLAVTIHDLIPLRMPEVMPSRGARGIYKLLNKHAVSRADAIFVPSQATRADVLDLFGPPESKVHVVSHAPDSLFIERARSGSCVMPGGFESIGRYVLSAGNPKPSKNLAALVEAFAGARKECDAKLVLVGSPDARFPEVGGAIEIHGLAKDVLFTGRVSDEELVALYANATAFIFPSLYEGFGLPPLEAMACETPVACSNVTSVPEVVGDAALLFDPSSTKEISDAIVRLMTDGALRESLVRKGLERVAGFNWEKTASEVLRVYETLINQ